MGEFSSPVLTFCADPYLVSVPPCVTSVARKKKGPLSFCWKCRWQVTPKHAYTLDPTKSEWADYAVQALCGNLTGKQVYNQFVGELLVTVFSACLATVYWSWPRKWDWCVQADCHLTTTTTKAQAVNDWSKPFPTVLASKGKKPLPSFETNDSILVRDLFVTGFLSFSVENL